MGSTLLSKSLFQFCWWIGLCSLLEVWPQANYGRATSFKRTYASTHCGSQDCCIQCPWSCQSTPPLETPGDSQESLPQSLEGSPLLSPGSWCAQGLVCALQESVFPVLWKFCNQMPSGFQSQIPWGFSVPLQDPQIGESVVGPRTFITVCKFLWYNCSPVYELSSQWLYGETNGDLLQKDLCHTPCLQICCSQSSCPRSRPLLTCVSTGDTQKHKGCSGSVSCWGIMSPGMHKFLSESSEHLW